MTRGQLPKAYLRIDPNIDQTHPENLDGFVRLLCAANRQPVRGQFRSRAVLVALFGRSAVDRLISRGDVVIATDGTVSVPGWNTWQEEDLTVGERMRRYRDRKRAAVTVLPTVTPVTSALPDRIPASKATRRLGVKALSLGSPEADGLARARENGDPARKRGPSAVGAILADFDWRSDAGAARLTKAQLDAWSTFGSEWDGFKAAWLAKGLRWPPKGTPDDDPEEAHPSQRALLYSILDARPTDLPRWVSEAPGRTTTAILTYVLDSWHAVREAVRP